jgi:rRNA processing protein Krr1/Pno1
VNIAREAVDMHLQGKSPKEIYNLITTKYEDLGDPTPTPAPK